MGVVQLFQHLLHYGFAEENSLGTHTELVAVLPYGSHFIVIQIDNLTMAAQQRCLLLFEIFRIDSSECFFT